METPLPRVPAQILSGAGGGRQEMSDSLRTWALVFQELLGPALQEGMGWSHGSEGADPECEVSLLWSIYSVSLLPNTLLSGISVLG